MYCCAAINHIVSLENFLGLPLNNLVISALQSAYWCNEAVRASLSILAYLNSLLGRLGIGLLASPRARFALWSVASSPKCSHRCLSNWDWGKARLYLAAGKQGYQVAYPYRTDPLS